MIVDLFKVEESSEGGGGELSEVPTTEGCLLLGVPTYLNVQTGNNHLLWLAKL
jgi:hypothetical protein